MEEYPTSHRLSIIYAAENTIDTIFKQYILVAYECLKHGKHLIFCTFFITNDPTAPFL